MKFTIIIPAYNSTSFINIPLDSLESQGFNGDFEVLIVNDGSTDSIKDSIEPYIKRHKNWKLINKQNGNWGSVINYVKNNNLIKGEYVTVLDSDDYFKKNMLKEVNKVKADVVITGIAKRENNKESRMPIFFTKKNWDIPKDRVFTPVSTPHGKFYKRDLFLSMIELRENVPYQDTVLFNDLASKAKSFKFIAEDLAVWWRDREGNSTTQSWDLKRATLWLETCQRIVTLPYVHAEANTWALMYLWELSRHYKGKVPFKINIDITKAKFMWLPFGMRNLAKIYFRYKTRRFR